MKKFDVGLLILILLLAVVAEYVSRRYVYVINWTAVGICATAFVAIWQLRENSDQKAHDRALETKRDVLFDGVRGMARANLAFGSLSNLSIPYEDSLKEFQSAMSDLTVSASVASLRTAKAGKDFTDTIGPLFMEAMAMRIRLDPSFREEGTDRYIHSRQRLAEFVLKNVVPVGKTMLRAIAAVRSDVGIAGESEKEFLDAVYPDEELIKKTIEKIRG